MDSMDSLWLILMQVYSSFHLNCFQDKDKEFNFAAIVFCEFVSGGGWLPWNIPGDAQNQRRDYVDCARET